MRALKVRNIDVNYSAPSELNVIALGYQGRRASPRSALAPGVIFRAVGAGISDSAANPPYETPLPFTVARAVAIQLLKSLPTPPASFGSSLLNPGSRFGSANPPTGMSCPRLKKVLSR